MKKAFNAGTVALAWGLLTAAAGAPQQPRPHPRTIFEAAQRALSAHDYPRAKQGFRGVLKIDHQSVAAYSNLGVAYMRLGEV